MAALEVRGLTKAYGDLVALEPLDLSVDEGETVMLVGPNGSGKTTFLRMVAGLLDPTEGEVDVLGVPAGSLGARGATSYIPDNPVLYDDLSVREHYEYIARLHGADDWDERGEALVERLGLSHRIDDLPARFSRGLRQKTSLLLGLIRPFSLLLVDEPFVGLDANGKEALLDLLDEAAHLGGTVVVSTHSLEFVDLADRCVGLRDGHLAYDGPAAKADINELVA